MILQAERERRARRAERQQSLQRTCVLAGGRRCDWCSFAPLDVGVVAWLSLRAVIGATGSTAAVCSYHLHAMIGSLA
jgi:hypothetical protein